MPHSNEPACALRRPGLSSSGRSAPVLSGKACEEEGCQTLRHHTWSLGSYLFGVGWAMAAPPSCTLGPLLRFDGSNPSHPIRSVEHE